MSKTILITGASSGIGKEAVSYFLSKNHTVIGLSRKKPLDVEIPYYECDLQDTSNIIETVKQIKQDYSRIDILINCAGVGTGGAIEEIESDLMKWVFEVNLFGLIELTKGFIPILKQGSNPKIINVGSVAGEITIPFQTSYSMAKASLQKFTEGLRIELKPFHIEVTTILPGDTKTGFTNHRKTIIKDLSPYKDRIERSIKKMEYDEQNGVSPLKVVKVIDRLINKKRLPVQRIVGLDYKLLVLLSKLLPKKIVEKIITKMYG